LSCGALHGLNALSFFLPSFLDEYFRLFRARMLRQKLPIYSIKSNANNHTWRVRCPPSSTVLQTAFPLLLEPFSLFDTGRPLEPIGPMAGGSEQAQRHHNTPKDVSIEVPHHPPLWSAPNQSRLSDRSRIEARGPMRRFGRRGGGDGCRQEHKDG
jgi:hypothetical protein